MGPPCRARPAWWDRSTSARYGEDVVLADHGVGSGYGQGLLDLRGFAGLLVFAGLASVAQSPELRPPSASAHSCCSETRAADGSEWAARRTSPIWSGLHHVVGRGDASGAVPRAGEQKRSPSRCSV